MMMSQTIQVQVQVHVLSANALYCNTLAMHVMMRIPVSTIFVNSMNHGFITADENILYSCRYVVWDRRFYLLDMSLCTEAVQASRYRYLTCRNVTSGAEKNVVESVFFQNILRK